MCSTYDLLHAKCTAENKASRTASSGVPHIPATALRCAQHHRWPAGSPRRSAETAGCPLCRSYSTQQPANTSTSVMTVPGGGSCSSCHALRAMNKLSITSGTKFAASIVINQPAAPGMHLVVLCRPVSTGSGSAVTGIRDWVAGSVEPSQ